MEKDIILVSSTNISDLVLISYSEENIYKSLMESLEKYGYFSFNNVKTQFIFKTKNADSIKTVLDKVFYDKKIEDTDLFHFDKELVIELFSLFDGEILYNRKYNELNKDIIKTSNKNVNYEVRDEVVINKKISEIKSKPVEIEEETIFEKKELIDNRNTQCIPDGEYYIKKNITKFGVVNGTAVVKDGIFTVKKGSICAPFNPSPHANPPEVRKRVSIKNSILMHDVVSGSPSSAGWVVIGSSNNGWVEWKDKHNRPIDRFRARR